MPPSASLRDVTTATASNDKSNCAPSAVRPEANQTSTSAADLIAKM